MRRTRTPRPRRRHRLRSVSPQCGLGPARVRTSPRTN